MGFSGKHLAKQEPLKSVTVLIVDDIPRMRETVRSMLRASGYNVLHMAESGNQALAMIESRPIHMVITDWNMPNMTGIELVKKIKHDPERFAIPVLMISDEMTAEKVLYAIEEGVDSFLVKPFSEAELIKHVKHIFKKVNNPDEIEQRVFEMRGLKLSGNFRKALELGHEIMNVKNDPRVMLMMCECLYHVKEYEKAMNMMLDSDEDIKTSEYTNLRGNIYMKLGKHDQGLFYLEKAVKENSLNPDRKMNLARAYVSAGRVGDAERVIQSVLSSKPTDLNFIDIAQLYLDMGEVDKAGLCLEQAVDPIPETVGVFNTYAIALRKANRFEESENIYRKCLLIAPDSQAIHYNLGFLLSTLGKYTEAQKILQKALKLKPDDRHTKSLLEKVNAKLH
jgi:two-component system, chemotaxis family, chemotaxis protein CheY